MKRILLNLFCVASTLTLGAQNIDVSGFTKLNVILLESPAKSTVIPTMDGGYYHAKGAAIIKYDSTNTMLWSNSFGSNVKINAVCEDGQGGAIVTGEVSGSLLLGTDSLTPFYTSTTGLYSADAFVARINQTGKIWWHRLGEFDNFSIGVDRGVSVKVADNKVYWLAHGRGLNLKFNGINYSRDEYSNNLALLSQIDIDGTINWTNVTKDGGVEPAEIAITANGVAYSGFNLGLSTAIDFGNSKTLRYTQGSLFVVMYNKLGAAQWVIVYDDDNNISSHSGIASDDEGNLYLAGRGSNFTSSFGIRKGMGYLIKMNGNDGTNTWTRFSTGGMSGPVFSNGKIYVTNNTSGTTYLQNGATDSIAFVKTPTTIGSEQFLVSYDKQGAISASIKGVGGLVGGTVDHLTATNSRVIMVGIYSANNALGSVTLPSTGGNVGSYFIGFYNIVTGTSGSTGLNKFSNQFMSSVYPNPANGLVNIETDLGNSIHEVLVTDITGKLYQVSVAVNANLATLNLTELNNGLYFVTIKSKAGNSTQKIIKQ